MSSHFLRTKPVCQNRIYGRVENWINLSPFIRYNVFISTHTANVPFASKLVNFLRRWGASFPKMDQPRDIFSSMTLSVNILLCWHFCGQFLGLDYFMIHCTVCVQVHSLLFYSRWFDISFIQNRSPYCSTNQRTLTFKTFSQYQFRRGNSISTKWKTCFGSPEMILYGF